MDTCQYCRFSEIAGEAVRDRLICKNKIGSKGVWHIVDHGWHCDNFSGKVATQPAADSRIAHISLTQGKVAIVDAEDYPDLCRYSWCAAKMPCNHYAIRGAGGRSFSMHRQIMQPPDGMVVDHINRNGLDNRRSNLRICTRRENAWNRHRRRSGKSRYKGVHWVGDMGMFRANITPHGKRVHLGYFKDEVKAAKAYDKAAKKSYGEFAYLNFPEEENHCKSSCFDVKHELNQGLDKEGFMDKRNIRVIGRRDFLKGVSLTTAGLVLGARPGLAGTGGGRGKPNVRGGGRGNRPNVVLVMTDDQGYGEIGAHGNDVIVTPNLDRLHNISMRLTNFHVNPNCAPTRAALLTGRYAYKTGVTSTLGTRAMLRNDEVTMGDVFRDNGYKTAMFAKWHLGDNYPLRPQDRGFDHVVRHKGGGVSQTPDYWGNDRFDDTYFRNGKAEKFEGFSTDIFFNEAMKFIERNKNKPFFIYLPTSAAHSPMNAPEKYIKLYEGKGVNEKHYGMITCVDDNIGKLRACLRRYGLEGNTILIFMTDNGSPGKDDVFSAGLRGGKGEKYDGAHRVPFFINWPDGSLAQGTSSNRLAAHFDVLPTLIGLCGLASPKGVRMDGVDLSGLVRGRDAGPLGRKIMLSRLVMTDRWRLILGKGGDDELYDMQNDRSQRHNVIDRHGGVAKELAAVYKRWDEDLQLQSKSSDYARIHIGSDAENPVRLMAQDWHNATGKIPWNPPRIVNGEKCNGQWLVRVAQAGRYRFELRRWPVEKGGPLQFGRQARLKVGGCEWTKGFDAEKDEVVTFEVDLEAGETEIQTWLDEERGAYYTYVTRLD